MSSDDPLRTINLNMLPVLRALLRHRHITRAAEELNLTQAAVSNTLRRLREHFGDPLLARHGRYMRLTNRGEALKAPLEAALADLQQVVGQESFAARFSKRRFRVATADYVTAVLGASLANSLSREAPSASIQFIAARQSSGDDLRSGAIDMIVGPRRILADSMAAADNYADELRMTPLLEERMVCIVKKGSVCSAGLSEQEYLARPHASFHLDIALPASLEVLRLRELGLRPPDRLIASEFVALALIVAGSDCVAVIPESLARVFAPAFQLTVLLPPIEIPAIELVMLWHRRLDGDEGHRWLRTTMQRSAREVTGGYRIQQDR